MRQCRLILCVNCDLWHQAPNPEQGDCILEQDGQTTINVTNYDTRCIYGLSESFDYTGNKI